VKKKHTSKSTWLTANFVNKFDKKLSWPVESSKIIDKLEQ